MKRRLFTYWLRGHTVFLAGFVFGLLLCALLGRWTARHNAMRDYVRLSHTLHSGTGFVPTIHQLRNMVQAKIKPGQTLVMIGGSSILYGTGQAEKEIWSLRLQEKLGPDFCVVNLSQTSGNYNGYGLTVLEGLAKKYPKFIFVTDGYPSSPDSFVWFRHLFWDAHYKGFTDPDFVSDDPKRYQIIQEYWARENEEYQVRSQNEKIGMFLDSILYFNDLWGYIDLFYINTAYNSVVAGSSFKPRIEYQDYATVDIPPIESRFFPRGSAMLELQLTNLHNQNRILSAAEIAKQTEKFKENPYRKIAAKTLIIQPFYAPYYLDFLGTKERSRHFSNAKIWADVLEQEGYQVRALTGFENEDYADARHFCVVGGNRLAGLVATDIRRMCDQLYGKTSHEK